jgi:hypothetical protein
MRPGSGRPELQRCGRHPGHCGQSHSGECDSQGHRTHLQRKTKAEGALILPAHGPRMRPGGGQKCRSHEQECEHAAECALAAGGRSCHAAEKTQSAAAGAIVASATAGAITPNWVPATAGAIAHTCRARPTGREVAKRPLAGRRYQHKRTRRSTSLHTNKTHHKLNPKPRHQSMHFGG